MCRLGFHQRGVGTLRILVSGGAGFIGSHLVERLVSQGDEVTVVDNLSTGSVKNLDSVMDDVEFIGSDVENIILSDSYDRIYHLASVANPADYMEMQLGVLSSASVGTQRLLDIAHRSGSRFYYFSSSEVYGSHGFGDVLSECSVSHVQLLTRRSPYFIAKMFGEQLTISYERAHGVDARIVRPFNIYGSRMDVRSPYGRVMTNFIRCAMAGEPLRITGDGEQVRSFCHVDDFIDGLMLLDSMDGRIPVVNIGNPDPVSINELAEKVLQITGSGSDIIHVDPVENEPRYRCPDVSLMEGLCKWSPKIGLDDGLKGMYLSMTQ